MTFTALRDGSMDLLTLPHGAARERLYVPLTVSILGVITAVALRLRNVGSVLSFSGALIGSLLIYIIPAILNINSKAGKGKMEVAVNYLIALFGVVIAVNGILHHSFLKDI